MNAILYVDRSFVEHAAALEREHRLLARPDITGSNLHTGMKQREKTTSYSPGSNPQPPSPPAVRVTSPSRPTKAVVLTGSLGTEADVTRREIGR